MGFGILDVWLWLAFLLAEKSMAEMIRRYGALDVHDAWGLIRDGVYAKPRMDGVKEFMIRGDYYFVENLMILAGKNYLDLEDRV